MTQPPEVGDLREALAWIRGHARKLRHGTDDWFELVEIETVADNALNRATLSPAPSQGDVELREALEPFATFAQRNVDDDGWNDFGVSTSRERILDWFGPSDFRRARDAARALAAMPVSAGYRDLLLTAKEALSNYACHGGEGVPCLRADYQCRQECGKPAGDALLAIEAALSDDDGKEGR